MSDKEFSISTRNLKTSSPDDFILTSKYPSYQILKEIKADFPITLDMDTGNVGEYIDVPHNLDYIPMVKVFLYDIADWEGDATGLQFGELPINGYALTYTFTYGVGNKNVRIRCGGIALYPSATFRFKVTIYRNELSDNIEKGEYTMFKVGTFTAPTAAGNLSVTGLGFKPKLIRFTLLYTSNETVAVGGFGATDGAQQFGVGLTASETPASAMDADTSHCLIATASSGAIFNSATLASFDPDGFTLTFDAVSVTAWTWGYEAYG